MFFMVKISKKELYVIDIYDAKHICCRLSKGNYVKNALISLIFDAQFICKFAHLLVLLTKTDLNIFACTHDNFYVVNYHRGYNKQRYSEALLEYFLNIKTH